MQPYNPIHQKIILASQSPRRQSLIKDLGLDFKIDVRETEEVYPDHLKGKEIAEYLATLKAAAFSREEIAEDHILITADTIVCLENHLLTKPQNEKHARKTLQLLSGKWH
jgi:septum formation protein